MFQDILESLSWRSVADIALVALLFYQIISMLKGTRAAQVVVGLLVIFFAYVVSSVLQLDTLNWLISKFYSSFILVVIVLFQDDIRRLLSRFGRGPFVSGLDEVQGAVVIDQVIAAVRTLSHDRIGALVVFERGVGLDRLYDRSIALDAVVTEQLLMSIFHTFSPLHDGAVIIQKNRVACASAHLPLSKSSSLSRKLGTRHSAALGICEETDAVVLVVSEETGAISLAYGGRLELQHSTAQARDQLIRLLLPLVERSERSRWGRRKNDRDSVDERSKARSRSQRLDDALRAEADRFEAAESLSAGSLTLEHPDGGVAVNYKDTQHHPGMSRSEDADDAEVLSHMAMAPTDSQVLQDVRRLTKLSSSEKYKPPVMPVMPPRDVTIGGAPIDAPTQDTSTQDTTLVPHDTSGEQKEQK